MLIIGLFTAILAYFCIVAPYRAHRQTVGEERFKQKFKIFKLRAVKAFYPSLHNLSYSQIEERYNLNLIYDNIGRHLR